MARFLNYFELKQRILEERDKIPREVPAASYELRATKPNHYGNAMRGGIRKALRCLEQCQGVTDVVEVVRCKDCKHNEDCIRRIQFWGRNPVLELNTTEYHPIDFCSYGERKGDGNA